MEDIHDHVCLSATLKDPRQFDKVDIPCTMMQLAAGRRVINAGEALMLVVSGAGELSIEVRVLPQDIDQLRPGLEAVLRLSAFNQRTTPELKGKVSLIAADLVTDQRSGVQYYPVRVAFAEGERERLGDFKLVPGTPVEGLIQTGYRTVFYCLTKPITDNMAKAFRKGTKETGA